MMKQSRNTHHRCLTVDVIGAVAFLVISAMAWQFGVRPVLERGSREALALSELDESRQSASEAAEQLNDIQQRIRMFEQDLAAGRVQLKPRDQLNTRLADLNELARTCGLSLDAVQPGKAQAGDRVDSVPITVRASCSYAQATLFLHRLTERMADVGVVGFELAKNVAQPDTPATIEIALRWYVRPELEARGGQKLRVVAGSEGVLR